MVKGSTNKGFTLIELLVVIAIVAVLSVVVVLTLNPAELLKQARDSNRISDLNTLKSALAVYLSDVTTGISVGADANCYQSGGTNVAGCGFTGFAATRTSTTTLPTASSRKVDGTGWIPVNFSAISSGSPVGTLPLDPVNSSTNYYAYVASSTQLVFELRSLLESAKYTAAGSIAATDGVNNSSYETGTSLSF